MYMQILNSIDVMFQNIINLIEVMYIPIINSIQIMYNHITNLIDVICKHKINHILLTVYKLKFNCLKQNFRKCYSYKRKLKSKLPHATGAVFLIKTNYRLRIISSRVTLFFYTVSSCIATQYYKVLPTEGQ